METLSAPPPSIQVSESGSGSESRDLKRKRVVSREWEQTLEQTLKMAISQVDFLERYITKLPPQNIPDDISSQLEYAKIVLDHFQNATFASIEETLEMLSVSMSTETNDRRINVLATSINSHFETLSRLYQELDKFKPPPSDYARHEVWVIWQSKETAILCGRPVEKTSLPLNILDDVFRKFQIQSAAQLPATSEAQNAMKAAHQLCHVMPGYFETEPKRGKAFDACIDRLIKREDVHVEDQGIADKLYKLKEVVIMIREDKVEMGSSHDAYMQISREYQIYVESLTQTGVNILNRGAPLLLLCLVGPMLIICGGFYDSASGRSIVQPLARPCLMLHDRLYEHRDMLSRHLFALSQAIDTLRTRYTGDKAFTPFTEYPAGVPRIYASYRTQSNLERTLTFVEPLKQNSGQALLFLARDRQDITIHPKLVKLVSGPYGLEVHQLLAQHQLAPTLYGQIPMKGAPTAYIMDYLAPLESNASGWITLFEYREWKSSWSESQRAIRNELDRVLNLLEQASMVHGDLRPNNVIIEINQNKLPTTRENGVGINLKVVDFDWAGKAGEVCYPLLRNPDVHWEGENGKAILAGHDRSLVDTWLPKK